MSSFFKALSLLFAAGAVGGLANALVVGLANALKNPAMAFSREMIYSRVIWGGLWGFIFVFSTNTKHYYWRGLVLSLAPTLVQLLLVFPLHHQGFFGMTLGPYAFMRVLVFNAVWGLAAAFWLKTVKST